MNIQPILAFCPDWLWCYLFYRIKDHNINLFCRGKIDDKSSDTLHLLYLINYL